MADIDIPDVDDDDTPLNAWIGIAVVILATFLGVCNVKDDNIVQKMQLKLVDRNDHWAWFQARNIRMSVYEATADELSIPLPNETSETAAARQKMANAYRARAKSQDEKMKVQESEAKTAFDDYLTLNDVDDQFDLCEAALSIGIAMMGMTALTKRWWLFWVAMVPSVFGVLMGVAGFIGVDTSYQPVRFFVQLLS